MSELEIVTITNPFSEDFSHRFNGELYQILKGETKSFAAPVAYHLAKHLSTQMVVAEARRGVTAKELANPRSSIHVKVSQLSVHDTHERRIALYKILGDENRVMEVIKRYPFKGFIGEMDEYRKFVEKISASKKELVAEKK